MRNSWKLFGCGAVLACFMASGTAQARPNYLAGFKDSYPDLKEAIEEAKCNVCHAGMDKKMKNDYGKAFGTALGSPKVGDAEKVKAALKKTEGEKSSVEGKTFGDLIKSGKLPGGK